MPRRHSLHPPSAPGAPRIGRRGEPGIDAAIAALTNRSRRALPGSSSWDDSTPDPLTGVPVRADFERELQRVLRRGEPDITVLRLALVGAGESTDAAELRRRIVLAAVNWQEALRPGDRLARVADDRFAVLLQGCPTSAAARVVERLRDATPPGAACAVGAATWDGQESARALLERCRHALDAAPQLQCSDVLRDPARVAAVHAANLLEARRDPTFNDAAKSVAWLLQVPAITIALVDDRFEHVIGAHGMGDCAAERESHLAEEALGLQSLITGRPLVASDAARHPALHDHHLVAGGEVAACATVPVVTPAGHVVGTIRATRTDRHAWTSDEVRLLRSTAARVASELQRLSHGLAAESAPAA
jgi:GGDEF domain-containing protein